MGVSLSSGIFAFWGVLINDIRQKCLISPVAIVSIIEDDCHLEWDLMEILGEHCLIESFITPECNFMSFVCNTLFLKAGCNHIMTVAKSTAKRTKPLLIENLKFIT